MRRFLSSLVLALALDLCDDWRAGCVRPTRCCPIPALEKRARTISAELRCMVCQNEFDRRFECRSRQGFASSGSRERLVAGDTDEQVLEFLVARYGEFVLLKPRLQTSTLLLWGFPIAALLAGGIAIVMAVRRRRMTPVETAPLSESEKKQLKKLFVASGD